MGLVLVLDLDLDLDLRVTWHSCYTCLLAGRAGGEVQEGGRAVEGAAEQRQEAGQFFLRMLNTCWWVGPCTRHFLYCHYFYCIFIWMLRYLYYTPSDQIYYTPLSGGCLHTPLFWATTLFLCDVMISYFFCVQPIHFVCFFFGFAQGFAGCPTGILKL